MINKIVFHRDKSTDEKFMKISSRLFISKRDNRFLTYMFIIYSIIYENRDLKVATATINYTHLLFTFKSILNFRAASIKAKIQIVPELLVYRGGRAIPVVPKQESVVIHASILLVISGASAGAWAHTVTFRHHLWPSRSASQRRQRQ